MDNDIPYFQTPGTMDSTPDKHRSRSPYNRKQIFDQSPMLNQQTQQVKDLILQCKSLELALDASKKSSEQLVQILHFKNSEIERLRSQENNGNEERLRFLINAMEQELSHFRQINQNPQMISQPQKFQEELHASRMEWQRQKQQMVTEYTELKEQFQESCIKIANLSNEVERLNQLLYESEQEIHYLQHNKQDSLTITMLNQEIKLLKKENDFLKQNQTHQEELEKAKIKIESQYLTIQKLQENVMFLKQDNEILNQKCKNYDQREVLQEQYEREIQEISEEYETTLEQIEQYKLEIKEIHLRHKAEKDQMEEKLNHQINKNHELEHEITTHSQDFRRLEHQLGERTRELEMIRAQNDRAVKKSMYDELKSNFDAIQQENFVILSLSKSRTQLKRIFP